VAGHLGGGQDQLGHLLRMVISERWPESISSSPPDATTVPSLTQSRPDQGSRVR
jgi:hypothetical protein